MTEIKLSTSRHGGRSKSLLFSERHKGSNLQLVQIEIKFFVCAYLKNWFYKNIMKSNLQKKKIILVENKKYITYFESMPENQYFLHNGVIF